MHDQTAANAGFEMRANVNAEVAMQCARSSTWSESQYSSCNCHYNWPHAKQCKLFRGSFFALAALKTGATTHDSPPSRLHICPSRSQMGTLIWRIMGAILEVIKPVQAGSTK
eukprot:6184715-Pleurochrysis_carterae.AAC.4